MNPIEKFINENGSAHNRGEIIKLLHEEQAVAARKLGDANARIDFLEAENASLRAKLATLETPGQFVKAGGVLWSKGADGGFESSPYCPKCKTVMHELFPDAPMYWSCTPCHVKVTHCPPPSPTTLPG